VAVWIDDAIEALWSMDDSCSLDVADRANGQAFVREVGDKIGVTRSEVRRLIDGAREHVAERIQHHQTEE